MDRVLVAAVAVVAVAVMALNALEYSVEGYEPQPIGCSGIEHKLADGRTLCVSNGQ